MSQEAAPVVEPSALASSSREPADHVIPEGLPSIPAAAPDEPWSAAFKDFERADAAQPWKPGGVVFVGSSSIRLWADLERQFTGWPAVIKRGFGGSQLADCVRNAKRLVSLYQPSLVLLYAGDNDLAAGRSPAQVRRSFELFVAGVREKQPGLPVAFISIKPSPSRARLMANVREANRLIQEYAAQAPNVHFIDVFTPMLAPNGEPRADLFAPDALHLSPAGYTLWKQVISTSLPPSLWTPTPP
ncbi:MAG: GDSL family lipase [Rubrivivax sp.]|nr:MAG: GDSL family lipase [Rubrivivax sp.]